MPTATAEVDLQSVAQRYLAAWEGRDANRIAALHTPDSRFQLHAGGEPAEGREAVRQAFSDIFEQWPSFSFETHRILFGERHWVLDWDLLATLKLDQDGKQVEQPVRLHCLDVVTIRDDGLVDRKDTFVDVAQVNSLFSRR